MTSESVSYEIYKLGRTIANSFDIIAGELVQINQHLERIVDQTPALAPTVWKLTANA